MKVACPSCQALFEADDSTPAGPGLPLCEACRSVGEAPALPPPPPVEGRRKRPQMPEIHLRPRRSRGEPSRVADVAPTAKIVEEAPPEGVEPTPSSGERVSLGELDTSKGSPERGGEPAAPVVLDGGFGRSGQPVSVFPAASRSTRGGGLSLGDYASDVEPVSLHDLAVVLAPPPLPAAWSGSASAMGSITPRSPAEVEAPEPASAGAKRRLRAKRAARKGKDRSKPSFFQVDSIPPPPASEDVNIDALSAEEAPKPSSRPSDLRDLLRARPSVRPARGLDLAGLTGGLFDELPPPDLAQLAEPPSTGPSPRPIPGGKSPAPRAPRSPAPEVAARRAPRPDVGAGVWIAFVAAGVAVGVAAFELGARTAPEPSGSVAEAVVPPRAEPRSPAIAAPPRAAPAPSPSPAASARSVTERRPDRTAVADAPRAPRDTPPAAARPPAQPAPTAAPAPPPPGGGPFNGAVAGAALARAAAAAAGCRQGDDPSGGARVSITFDPSGRVTSARVVGPPFQGTRTGGCIALSFGSASVPPFAGDPVTVSTDVNVR